MGIAERKERERLQRRNDIIDAAEQIFFKQGFEAATVESIAEKAELSKATLYLYFKSKEDLYFAVFMRGQQKLFSLIDEAENSARGVKEKIEDYIQAIVSFQKKYPDYFEAMFYFQTHSLHQYIDKENPDIVSNREIDQVYIEKWTRVVETGKKEGLIRSDLEPRSTVLIIWLQLSGFLKMYSVLSDEIAKQLKIDKDVLLQEYCNLILRGILKHS